MAHLVVLIATRAPYFQPDPLPRRHRAPIDFLALFALEGDDVFRARSRLFERDDASRAPQQPALVHGMMYRRAFARLHAHCTACGVAIQAGSYRPRIYREGDAEYADLCDPCALVLGTEELRAFVAAARDRKRAG